MISQSRQQIEPRALRRRVPRCEDGRVSTSDAYGRASALLAMADERCISAARPSRDSYLSSIRSSTHVRNRRGGGFYPGYSHGLTVGDAGSPEPCGTRRESYSSARRHWQSAARIQ